MNTHKGKPLTRRLKQEVLELADEGLERLDVYTQRQLASLQETDNHIDGSQSLFSSQSSSHHSNKQKKTSISQQLTGFVWVQCEIPSCQKWRRIAAVHADQLNDDPWYCSMNPDPFTANCEAPEEDYTHFDKLARQVGVKFVMSLLQVGALVWAKTAGYCRWPGVITRDPITGVHVHVDMDGDPHSYHVEYLGNPHSHSWVKSSNVEVYGHKETAKFEKPKFNPKRKGRGRKLQQSGYSTKNKQTYRRVRVEEVMKEADHLLNMTLDDRLKEVVFKYDPPVGDSFEGSRVQDLKESSVSNTPCKHCGTQTAKAKKSKQLKVKLKEKQNICGGIRTQRKAKSNSYPDKYRQSDSQHLQMEEIQKHNLCADQEVRFDVTPLGSPEMFSQSLLNVSSSMLDKSKEEKFSIDIEMYRRNERAFEHDVLRFMKRNHLKLCRSPVWHKVPVSLFQLFSAVHERGGFKMACEKKAWMSIYRELTHSTNATSGRPAKVFYVRNLFPYELFISGKDFSKALQQHGRLEQTSGTADKRCKGFKSEQNWKNIKEEDRKKDEVTDLGNHDNEALNYVICQESEEDTDLEALLGELEKDYNSLFQTDHTSKLEESKKKMGIDITFHDESPLDNNSPNVQYANTASEFGHSILPDYDGLQEVPVGMSFSESQSTLSQEQIITEMKALEDQVTAFHTEMEMLL